MSAHVLVPVKRLDGAKTRLADVLEPAERAALMQELLAHVLGVVEEARLGPVTVVSAEQLELNGVPRFDDRGLPWNEALTAAVAAVDEDDVAVVVAADLPFLTADDVRQLVQSTPARGLAIARARDGGTNAVAMRPPGILETRFGEAQSAAVHEELAHALGLDVIVVDRPGLAFDIDTPEDLAAWRDRSP